MKEARITCRTRSVRIVDLGLDLVRHDVVFIPAGKASGSIDLRNMQGAGAVEVFYVQRSKETRLAVPNVPPGTGTPPKVRKALTQAKSTEIDEDALADRIAEKLMAYVGQPVSEGLLQQMQSTVEASLEGLRQALLGTTRSRLGTIEADVLVPEIAFIPKDIVGAMKGTVEVEEAESDGAGGVDDAVSALKTARKRRGSHE